MIPLFTIIFYAEEPIPSLTIRRETRHKSIDRDYLAILFVFYNILGTIPSNDSPRRELIIDYYYINLNREETIEEERFFDRVSFKLSMIDMKGGEEARIDE